jgi:hypothetical protein
MIPLKILKTAIKVKKHKFNLKKLIRLLRKDKMLQLM